VPVCSFLLKRNESFEYDLLKNNSKERYFTLKHSAWSQQDIKKRLLICPACDVTVISNLAILMYSVRSVIQIFKPLALCFR
jgi:hypothetical protein